MKLNIFLGFCVAGVVIGLVIPPLVWVLGHTCGELCEVFTRGWNASFMP
jgi:hypothetical protein